MTDPNRSGSDRNGRFRMFSSIRSFTWICGLLGLVQTMSFTYWIPTLSTFEKRFRIPSRTVEHVSALGRHLQLYCDYPQSLMLQTASKSRNMFYENKKQEATEIRWMLSGNEISQILLSLLLTYYGGQRNRPLWIAWGVAFSAASCYLLALPHFIYGPGQAALSIIKENTSDYGTTNNLSTSYKRNLGLCTRNEEEEDGCGDGDVGVEDEATLVAPILVFVSQFILGVGSSLYFTLGQTYIDDNIKKKKNSPFLLGLTLALKTIGPAFGFLLGNICLKIFVDPTLSPPISSRENPKWLGAWWLGWIITGSLLLCFAVLISFFPKELQSRNSHQTDNRMMVHFQDNSAEKALLEKKYNNIEYNSVKQSTIGEFPAAFKRLVVNKLLVVNILSSVVYTLAGSGYMIYLNKYIEIQFNKTVGRIAPGVSMLLSMAIGSLLSGAVITKFKPRALYLCAWNVIVGCLFIVGELSMISLSCPDGPIAGFGLSNNSLQVSNLCNNKCNCESMLFAPVCSMETNVTYYSACHAGCQSYTFLNQSKTRVFTNCTCIDMTNLHQDTQTSSAPSSDNWNAMEGSCPVPCGNEFIFYILISVMMYLFYYSGKTGNLLISMRAVKPEDKSFSQGLSLTLISLFGSIPGPILYGAIIDSSCLQWDKSCNSKGHCSFYDKEGFRYGINATAAGLTAVAVILDVVVCYLSKDLELYDEPSIVKGRTKNSRNENSVNFPSTEEKRI